MNWTAIRHVAANSMLAPLLLALACGTAQAQTDEGAEDAIIVEAPRVLPPPSPPSPRSATSGAPIVTTTVKIYALYGDLDLAQPADTDRLMTRIERVAQDACRYLDSLFPLNPDPDCVGKAVASAMPAAKAVIAAAGQ